jgi:hypothetical protein
MASANKKIYLPVIYYQVYKQNIIAAQQYFRPIDCTKHEIGHVST